MTARIAAAIALAAAFGLVAAPAAAMADGLSGGTAEVAGAVAVAEVTTDGGGGDDDEWEA